MTQISTFWFQSFLSCKLQLGDEVAVSDWSKTRPQSSHVSFNPDLDINLINLKAQQVVVLM